ncbi:DEAD/DEAH box helicase [Sphingobacterium sp. GVS05A]|uniref:DEAD/DEAH box helicase n=1 Tax=Sphingobacterium sp. GVS05A TaxID=2862679 RepID=UPI001CC031EA|nr:DEAD/DEAH box helicase [Sphingobacterium sp. GVS05A]
MPKHIDEIRAVIDLNPNNAITQFICDRQMRVIQSAFNYLSKSNQNNIIYIADEVGLGKTYIAMGIMALFRIFEPRESHVDMVIVPKANLQDKWYKELELFMALNYLPQSKRSSATIETGRYSNKIHTKLGQIDAEYSFHLLRMSSFSSILSSSKEDSEETRLYLKSRLLDDVFQHDCYCQDILEQAWKKGYFHKENKIKLGNLIAYLLNCMSIPVSCLVVDEAHYYKKGASIADPYLSIRNQVTSRFLGAVKDPDLLSDFPALEGRVKFPLAQKVICLSATPKDVWIGEIRNQLDCFLPSHVLSHSYFDEEILNKLPHFLIRGNMEYTINSASISRNQSREEHRKGNVNKSEVPEILCIEDNVDGLFWQLLQYKSLKHLQVKNGVAFEIGMLAGFESYLIDVKGKGKEGQSDVEYDLPTNSRKNKSEDEEVIRNIVESYTKTFPEKLPPHPKQSKFETELLQQMGTHEKSLTFVRRIHTVGDMERRLLHSYEREIVIKQQLSFSGRYKKFGQSKKVINLIARWKEKGIDLQSFYEKFIARYAFKKKWRQLTSDHGNYETILQLIKRFAYSEWELQLGLLREIVNKEQEEDQKVYQAVCDHIVRGLQNVSSSLERQILDRMTALFPAYLSDLLNEDDVENTLQYKEDTDHYFFSKYFSKGEPGYSLRQKMYRQNWFDLDLDVSINTSGLGHLSQHKPENNTSFLTDLLLRHCSGEMSHWIQEQEEENPDPADFSKAIQTLNAILRNIMRHGTGLLAVFVANSHDQNFADNMLELLVHKDAPFHFVLTEIKTIIKDFKLLLNVNFRNKSEQEINVMMRSLSPVIGISGQSRRNRSLVAAQFRMPGFPYALIATDILREGEDLHTYCQNIYHYGVAWNPSDMEQRTGRIDRINSMSFRKLNTSQELSFPNKLHVFYPYLSQSFEINQVSKLLTNINRFTETFNTIGEKHNFDTTASLDEKITDSSLPPQIKHKIVALYDVDNFKTD